MDQPDGIESAEDSHAQMESSIAGSPQLQTITEEYFEEVCGRVNELIQSLPSPEISDELQRVLMVCQILKRSLTSERMKNDELLGDLQNMGDQVMQSVKIGDEDKRQIQQLRMLIDRERLERDKAQSREEEAHKQMVVMRERMEDLQREFSDKFATPKADDQTAAGVRQRENAIKERDRLTNEVDELNNRLLLMKEYVDEMEQLKQQLETKNKELYKLLDETSSESFKDKRSLESLRAELDRVTVERDQKLEEVNHFRSKSEAGHKSSIQTQLHVAALKSNIERLNTSNTLQSMKLSKLTGECENLTHLKDKLVHDLGVKSNILKLKEDENNKFRLETSKLVKSKEMLSKKFTALEMAKSALDQEVTKLKGVLANMEKEQELSRKTYDKTKSQIDNITRERDLVRKELQKVAKQNDDLAEQNLLHEQQIRNLESELKHNLACSQRQKESIKKLERDRDRMAEDIQQFVEKLEKSREDSQMKSAQILDIKATVQDQLNGIQALKQQIDFLKTDKLNLQRELQQLQQDLEDSKNRLRGSGRQMEQMKKIIDSKDVELLRQNKHIEKVEKDKQLILKDVQSLQVQLQHTRSEMKEKQMECDRLLKKSIYEAEERNSALAKQLEALNNQRDLLNVKLMEHSEEIATLNEKLTNAQGALNRSEVQYANRLDDIRLLKIEIGNLRSQSNTLSRGLANTTDMRQEVLQLNRSLTQERIKIKALEQEMTTPMNVHRWRELQGKDPEKMELIDKVQTLQKRILKQNADATKQGSTVLVAQEATARLKQFALKNNSDQQQRLNATQRALSAQTKKWKSAIAELKIREMDLKTKSSTVEDLKQSLVDTKKELAKERREKQRLLELRASVSAGGGIGGSNVTAYRHMMMTTSTAGPAQPGSRVTRALVSAVGPRKFN